MSSRKTGLYFSTLQLREKKSEVQSQLGILSREFTEVTKVTAGALLTRGARSLQEPLL